MTLEEILGWWSFLFLGVLVYSIGEFVKRKVVPLIKWQWVLKWYDRTVVGHAPIVATGVAAIPVFPMPDQIDEGIGARLLFGFVAGVCASWSYKAAMRILGKDTKSKNEDTKDADAEEL